VWKAKSSGRQRAASKVRPVRARLFVEQLEVRNLFSAGQWAAYFSGLAPADNLNDQTHIGQNLLHYAGLQDQNVAVVGALDLSGSFIVQTPANVTQETLTSELQAVPGFIFVQDYTPDNSGGGGEGDDNNGINGDFIDGDGYNATFGGPFDYQTYLLEEQQGIIQTPAGPVTQPPGTNDVLTNNNLGSNGASGFTHSETTTISFGNTVLVGYNDSGENNVASNKFTGWSRSTDGGATFTDGGPLPTNPNGDVGDPVLARDNTTGRVYYATLQFSGSGLDVFHSDDGGATWSAPAQGAPGKNGFQDKEWIAVDNFSGPGQGNVYLANRDFGSGNGIYFYRSTNQGATFGPNGGTAIATAGATQGAFVTVTPDHAVEVYWFDGAFIRMRKSTDQGLTFGATVNVVSNLVGGVNGDLGLTGIRQGTATAAGFRSNEFPHAAVNPVNGNIYVTYANRGAGADKADIFLKQSTDGGATWSAAVKVNDDTTTTDQWQPTLAVTPDGSTLGIFYYSRQEDPANNLFKYYGRIATISGSTLTFTPSFAVSDTASLPEFGRDALVNSIYMGDYNTAYGAPGAFYVSWSDNRFNLPNGAPRKEPDVFFNKITLGLQVVSTDPVVGSLVVGTAPTVFTVNVTDPVDPASLHADALKVNGIAASSDSYTPGTTTITFTFAASPVTSPGLQTMHIDAGAFTRASDGNPVGQFDGTFRYAAVQLQVASTNPPVGATFTIPPSGTITYDVNFNMAVDPASVHTNSLSLSGIPGAFVSAVTVLAGNTTARFTLAGVTTEATLTASIAAAAITDTYGNPIAAFSGTYNVDIPVQAFPTHLGGTTPSGSLVYSRSTSDSVNGPADGESYTLNVNAGQTITVLVTPTNPALQPMVQVTDPSGALLGSATASAAGKKALLETVAAQAAGTYTITITGAGGTTGSFTVQVTLNAALDTGVNDGASNNTLATAQDINPSFVTLQTALAQATRGAVLGQTLDATFDYYSFTLSAGDTTTLALKGQVASTINVDLLDSGGNVLASGVGGATNLDEVISNFAVAAAGTYYARVTGGSNIPYNLVVDRNAAFDTEPNATFAQAQDLTGTQGALGATGGGSGGTARVGYYTDFNAFDTAPAAPITLAGYTPVQITDISTLNFNTFDILMLDESSNGGPSSALVAELPAIQNWVQGGGILITHDRFVNASVGTNPFLLGAPGAVAHRDFSFGANLNVIPPGGTLVTNGPFGTIDDASLSGGSYSNHGWVDAPTLPAGATDILSAGASADRVSALAYGLGSGLVYYASIPLDYYLDQSGTGQPGANFRTIYTPNALTFVNSFRAPPEDWYQVTLTGDQTALKLETRVPSAGPGEFVNNLQPHLQLYDSSDTLLQEGTILPDGRNESLLATGLTAGSTYYVHVTARSNTLGEYFLGVTPLRTPAITVTVDDTDPGFSTVLPDWSTVSDSNAYGGSYQTHAGVPGDTDFAQWQYNLNAVAGNQYDIFASWVAGPLNATNATYTIYEDGTAIATITLDQTRSPNTGLVGGTLVQRLYTYTPTTTGVHVITLQLSDDANGNVVADAVFDPPVTPGVPAAPPAQAVPLGHAVALTPTPTPAPAVRDVTALPAALSAPPMALNLSAASAVSPVSAAVQAVTPINLGVAGAPAALPLASVEPVLANLSAGMVVTPAAVPFSIDPPLTDRAAPERVLAALAAEPQMAEETPAPTPDWAVVPLAPLVPLDASVDDDVFSTLGARLAQGPCLETFAWPNEDAGPESPAGAGDD
jgi:hypothetical protein